MTEGRCNQDTPPAATAQWDKAEAEQLIARYVTVKGGLMAALHGLQEAFGYVPTESYPLLADGFNLSEAEVYGVKSFYHDFTSAPKGRHVIQVCQAESCQSRGSRALTHHIQNKLGITMGQTSHNEHYTLEPVYCLGNCAVSPNITFDGKLHGRVSPDLFDHLLKKAT